MKTIHKVSTWLLIALGILHTGLTPLFYSSFTVDALWFAGTGLGTLFLGLLNLMVFNALPGSALKLCLAANIIGCVYGVLIVIVLPEPQAFLALLAFLGAVLGLIFARKSFLEVLTIINAALSGK